MERTTLAMIALAASVMFADAQSAKPPYEPGLGELMTATQIRHAVAFDELTSGCNACHAAANKPFIRIQRPIEPPLTNQNFAPTK